MLDKNPDGELASNFPDPVNSILCEDAFTKEAAIQGISCMSSARVILLDFDHLFSGYVNSGMVPKNDNLRIYSPAKENWQEVLKEVIVQASSCRVVLIVDSVNGFFGIFDGKDSGRYANSCMMMLSSCVRSAGGKIFLCSVARIKENEGWILHPTGRHVLDIRTVSKFFARRQDGVRIESLSPENKVGRVFRM